MNKLDKKFKIKDDIKNSYLYFDSTIDGHRYKTKARYNKEPKDKALEQINNKKQEIIKKLTVDFE